MSVLGTPRFGIEAAPRRRAAAAARPGPARRPRRWPAPPAGALPRGVGRRQLQAPPLAAAAGILTEFFFRTYGFSFPYIRYYFSVEMAHHNVGLTCR